MVVILAGGGVITDLAGTSWQINEAGININYMGTPLDLTFISNEEAFAVIGTSGTKTRYLYYGNGQSTTRVAYATTLGALTSWYDDAYRIISITGGADTTNTVFISWLQENATQIS